jgi:hypothetical protein
MLTCAVNLEHEENKYPRYVLYPAIARDVSRRVKTRLGDQFNPLQPGCEWSSIPIYI